MEAEGEKNPQGKNEGNLKIHWKLHRVTWWPNWTIGMGRGYGMRVLKEAEAIRSPLACRRVCSGGTLKNSK